MLPVGQYNNAIQYYRYLVYASYKNCPVAYYNSSAHKAAVTHTTTTQPFYSSLDFVPWHPAVTHLD